MKAFNILENQKKRAFRLLKDKEGTRNLLQKVNHVIYNNKEVFLEYREYLNDMNRMVKAVYKGQYKQLSYSRLVLIIAALLYIINPVDAISDFLPFLGFTDDIMILGWVVSQVKDEIDNFLAWEDHLIESL